MILIVPRLLTLLLTLLLGVSPLPNANLGTNLKTRNDFNLLWHTGLPRNIYTATNIKEARPWKYVRRVAQATSVGEGMADPETWDAWARRKIADFLFYQ